MVHDTKINSPRPEIESKNQNETASTSEIKDYYYVYQNILTLEKVLRLVEVLSRKKNEITILMAQLEEVCSSAFKTSAVQLTQAIDDFNTYLFLEINQLRSKQKNN